MILVTCLTCRWFKPWPANPTAAMGRCMHPHQHGSWFAQEAHPCADHEATEEPRNVR